MTHVLPRPVPKARPYWRLLLLVPSLATLAIGYHYYTNFDRGGVVSALKLSTKQGLVGQAAEAVSNISLSSPDLYLKLYTPKGEQKLAVKKDTPIGNGLTWDLDRAAPLRDIQRVEIWDHYRITSDKPLDRISFDGSAWGMDGQRFHIELVGEQFRPPSWALPTAAVGAVLTFLCVVRFIWDQVV
jgi:hypothetical protein